MVITVYWAAFDSLHSTFNYTWLYSHATLIRCCFWTITSYCQNVLVFYYSKLIFFPISFHFELRKGSNGRGKSGRNKCLLSTSFPGLFHCFPDFYSPNFYHLFLCPIPRAPPPPSPSISASGFPTIIRITQSLKNKMKRPNVFPQKGLGPKGTWN